MFYIHILLNKEFYLSTIRTLLLNTIDKQKKRRPLSLLYFEYIKIDRDKSTFKSHRDFDSEIEMTFKHF